MTEDQEKGQSEQDQHAPEEAPPDNIDAQREEAQNPSDQNPASGQPTQVAATPSDQTVETEDGPQDAPEGYEPQVQLQPGQTGGIVERHGEQVSDVEAVANDEDESGADEDDDSAVDDPDSPEVSSEADNPGESG